MIKIIIGTQWGDEGKGKFVDYFAKKAEVTVRYNGSGGAAHSVVNNFGKFKLHLLPSGVFSPKTKLLITNGVAIEPELLLNEIKEVEKNGISLKNRLFISPRCHLVFPYHKILDRLTNAAFAKDHKTGPTTGRGNGPVNADKISYQGIRFYDLYDKNHFSNRLKVAVELKNKFIKSLDGEEVRFAQIKKDYLFYFAKLRSYLCETLPVLERSLKENKNVLFEGVNGFLLDNEWGAYPHVTTASVLTTDVARGSGINPYLYRHEVIGIAKAYLTRVDNGESPLPTEWLENRKTKNFRDRAGEYASGTGRPRRIAWFDTEVVKLCHKFCRLQYLCLTRLDTLSGLKKIKIGVGYRVNGRKVNYLDGDAEFYRRVKPVYLETAGWSDDIAGCKKYQELPANARRYVELIEKLVGIKIKYVSTGAETDAVMRINL